MNYLTDISYSSEPKIIAEIGINHDGSLDRAKHLAELAINSGAHIIKSQFHIPKEEMSQDAMKLIPSHCTESIYEIMENCSLSAKEERQFKDFVESLGGVYLSTPFSLKAAKILAEEFNVSAFKIGSGECSNIPLLSLVASYKLPVIMSTGMNSLESVSISYDHLLNMGCPKVYLMHTTNLYPTPFELVRLGAIAELQSLSSINDVGLSDHTTSNLACFGAVALGAVLLERHFIDNKDVPGPDIENSMTPNELKELQEGSYTMYKMRGGSKVELLGEESNTRDFAIATLVYTSNLPKGHILTRHDLTPKRPRVGDFDACDLELLIGKELAVDTKADTHLRKSDLN